MEKRETNIYLETDYLISLSILRKVFNSLGELKNELVSKNKDVTSAKKDISRIRDFIYNMPIWSDLDDTKNIEDKDKVFIVGKKISRKMEGKVPSYYLIDVINDRWNNVNGVIEDIDEIRMNIRNYSSKVFSAYFTLNDNRI